MFNFTIKDQHLITLLKDYSISVEDGHPKLQLIKLLIMEMESLFPKLSLENLLILMKIVDHILLGLISMMLL